MAEENLRPTKEELAEALRPAEDARRRYQALFDLAPDGYLVTDLEGNIQEANRSAASLLAIPQDLLVGQSFATFIPEPDRPMFQFQLELLPQVERLQDWDLQLQPGQGDSFPVAVTVAVVSDSQGQLTNLRWQVRNITKRKRAEEEIKVLNATLERQIAEQTAQASESSARYRIISELVSDFAYCFRFEPDGAAQPVWMTESLRRNLGLALEEIAGKGWIGLIHPDDLPNMLEHNRILLSNQAHVVEYRVVLKDGAERWIRDYSRPVWDESEARVVQVIGAAQDITERKRAEEALLRSTQRLRALRDVDRDILSARSSDEIGNAALSHLRELLPCQQCEIYLFEWETREAVQLAIHADGKFISSGLRLPLDEFGDISKLRVDEYDLRRDLTLDADSLFVQPLLAKGLRSYVRVPLISRKVLIGSLNVGAKQPNAFQAEDLEIIREIADQFTIVVAHARAYEEAHRSFSDLSIIYAAAQRIQQLNRLERIASEIPNILSGWLPFDYLSTLLLDEHTGSLVPFAVHRRATDSLGELVEVKPPDNSLVHSEIPEWVAQTGISLRTDDVRQDSRFPCKDDQIKSVLCVPLRIGNRIAGVLNAESLESHAYTTSHRRLLETVAAQLGTAIDKAKLFEQVRAGREQLQALSKQLLEAQEAERRSIARELHDEIGQGLSALKMNLLILQKSFQEAGHETLLAARLADSAALTEQILKQVRNMSLDLRPSLLDDFGLEAAVRWLLDQQSKRTGLATDLVTVGLEARLPPGIETLCYRVVQEALTNIVRHARAHKVRIEIKVSGGELDLRVRDDGIGFDVAAARKRAIQGESLGVLGMEERVLLARGQLEIDSAPGCPTEIRARLPIPARDSAPPLIERRSEPRNLT